MGQYQPDPNVLAYAAAARGFGSGAPLQTPGTQITQTPATSRLTFRQRLGLFIAGADAPNALFPPQQPLQPLAQAPQFGVVGRQWDYPVGYNLWVTPRNNEQITFATLKALAGPGGYDVLRIIIERVKDEIVTAGWTISPKDKKKKRDARCDEVQQFLRYPDKQHNWRDWLRMLLEQMIVYDAPAVWLRPDRGGNLYSLDLIDGAQITPKVMLDGRLPTPDVGPAYQQVIKTGLPAVDYIQPVRRGQPVPMDNTGWPMPELLYKPRNPRTDSVYGFGPVEQIITTINIALMREAYLSQYYTSGSAPDTVFTTPATWTTQDIANFKVWWDSVLKGNLGERRGTMFVPDGAKPIDMKEKALTDETDQWLIRIMCFCFGLSPMPFIKIVNRATGQQHAEQQKEEGQVTFQTWVADFMDVVIEVKFGYDDIGFTWEEEDSTDPLVEAQRYQIYLNSKVFHPDEVRAKLGEDAMDDDLRAEMDMATFAATPNATILPDDQQQVQNDHALAMQAAKPAPVVQGPSKTELAVLEKLAQPAVPHTFNIDMPKIDIAPAAVNVSSPPVTVNMPEIKQPDVFVDVGGVSIQNKTETKAERKGEREIVVKRGPDGQLQGEIIERRTVRGERDADGKIVAKIEG